MVPSLAGTLGPCNRAGDVAGRTPPALGAVRNLGDTAGEPCRAYPSRGRRRVVAVEPRGVVSAARGFARAADGQSISHRRGAALRYRVLSVAGLVAVLVVAAAVSRLADDEPRIVAVELPDGVRYVGELEGGAFHGHGVMTFASGARYEGSFRGGRYHGAGVYDWADGRRYEGSFRGGLPNGHGVMTYPDGARYEGSFRDDEFDGEGVYRFPDGRELAGEFRAGVFYGPAGPRRPSPAKRGEGIEGLGA